MAVNHLWNRRNESKSQLFLPWKVMVSWSLAIYSPQQKKYYVLLFLIRAWIQMLHIFPYSESAAIEVGKKYQKSRGLKRAIAEMETCINAIRNTLKEKRTKINTDSVPSPVSAKSKSKAVNCDRLLRSSSVQPRILRSSKKKWLNLMWLFSICSQVQCEYQSI